MVAAVERKPRLRIDGWVRIEGGYGGKYNGRPAKIRKIDKKRGAAELAIADNEIYWFESRYFALITEAEAIALQQQPIEAVGAAAERDSLPEFLAEISEALEPDGSATEGKWGRDAVISAEETAIAQVSEVVEAEIIPDLSDLEAQIEAGRQLIEQGEQRIWSAAALIRKHKLWGADYQSFEDYCLKRWGWQKSNAHEVAAAGEVVLQLKESGATEIPTSIAAIRPLKNLEPEQRLQVLATAKAQAGKITAQTVKLAALAVSTPTPSPTPNPQPLNPIPPVRAALPPPSPDRPWQLGDWVRGRTDEGEWVEGSVGAVGVGYLRLAGNIAVYEPTLLQPYPYSEVAPTEAMSVDPSASGNTSNESSSDLSQAQKQLLDKLKAIALEKSEGVYRDLSPLTPDLDQLAAIVEEVETAILEVLEFHFL